MTQLTLKQMRELERAKRASQPKAKPKAKPKKARLHWQEVVRPTLSECVR